MEIKKETSFRLSVSIFADLALSIFIDTLGHL